MAIQPINVGAAPNDGTGDAARDAFQKINENFDASYIRRFDSVFAMRDDATAASVAVGERVLTVEEGLTYQRMAAGSTGADYQTGGGGAIFAPVYQSAPLDYYARAHEVFRFRRAGRVEIAADSLVSLTYGDDTENDNTAALQELADRPTRGQEIIVFSPGVLRHEQVNGRGGMYWQGPVEAPVTFRLRDNINLVNHSSISIQGQANNFGALVGIAIDGNGGAVGTTLNSEGLEYDNVRGWFHARVNVSRAVADNYDHDNSGDHIYMYCTSIDPGKDGFHVSGGSYNNWHLECLSSGQSGNSNRGAFTSISRDSPGGNVFINCIASNSSRGFQIQIGDNADGPNNVVVGCWSVDCDQADDVSGIGTGAAPQSIQSQPELATDPRRTVFVGASSANFFNGNVYAESYLIAQAGTRTVGLRVTMFGGHGSSGVSHETVVFALRTSQAGALIGETQVSQINAGHHDIRFIRTGEFTYRLEVENTRGSTNGEVVVESVFVHNPSVTVTRVSVTP